MSAVQRSALAGQWYPANRASLESEIRGYIENAQVPATNDEVVAVMSPHAGYAFSGPVAGYSFKALEGQQVDTAIIIAVCHSGAARASILDAEAYETPLGRTDIDTELVQECIQRIPSLSYVEAAHGGMMGRAENSSELQVPFVQVALPGCKLVEILIGGKDPGLCAEVADGLTAILKEHPDKRTVLIASSDMTHYPPYEDASRIDRAALDALVSMDEQQIRERLKALESEPVRDLHCVLCGVGAVLVTLRAAKGLGADRAEILRYQNSGDASSGSREGVVGYGSVAFYRSAESA